MNHAPAPSLRAEPVSNWPRVVVSLFAGLLFALGLGLSGMTQADKVIGFLNLAGDWDPSLAFVMGGALLVYVPTYRWYQREQAPLLGGECAVPTNSYIDRRLIIGAALFGVGWALGGFCPGPGLVAAMAGPSSAWLFVGTMALGMIVHKQWTALSD